LDLLRQSAPWDNLLDEKEFQVQQADIVPYEEKGCTISTLHNLQDSAAHNLLPKQTAAYILW
jgi:hypothetical protein